MLPVLQIIHVTDLHVKHISASPDHKLYATKRRIAARIAQKIIENLDLFDWNEGTQGHYYHAPASFSRFLKKWREDDKRWYGKPGEDSAQTWLIDTGDMTAFGDDASLAAGRKYLDEWRSDLGDCELRTLYGNHDAWPEILPTHVIFGCMLGEIKIQRQRITTRPEWNFADWLDNPLTVEIPGTAAHGASRIELYALDSVCWGAFSNTRAVGRISAADLETLRKRLREQWQGSQTRHFRIIALHHPLAFPYTYKKSHSLVVLPSMTLRQTAKVMRELRNDRDDPRLLGPLAHLFLSGHTHTAYPAGSIPDGIMGNQGLLSAAQLQLVGGPLMLNKSERAANAAVNQEPTQESRQKRRYMKSVMDWSNCQAQILRFYSDPDQYGQITMHRIPVSAVDGSVYIEGAPSVLKMTYA
ncbi:MAG: metallophosphoesterase [Acidobacteria bacterium]|nr:metallophosphoesterase [Acidobacteriota bacterium]